MSSRQCGNIEAQESFLLWCGWGGGILARSVYLYRVKEKGGRNDRFLKKCIRATVFCQLTMNCRNNGIIKKEILIINPRTRYSLPQSRRIQFTSWVVHARGPAKVRSFPLTFSLRRAINVNRAMSWRKQDNCLRVTYLNKRSRRIEFTWVSMYAIRVGASVPQTDFSSNIGTAYCPIRPWTNWKQDSY